MAMAVKNLVTSIAQKPKSVFKTSKILECKIFYFNQLWYNYIESIYVIINLELKSSISGTITERFCSPLKFFFNLDLKLKRLRNTSVRDMAVITGYKLSYLLTIPSIEHLLNTNFGADNEVKLFL